MIRNTATLLLLVVGVSADYLQNPFEEYVKASQFCFNLLRIPDDYAILFLNEIYPNEVLVQRYIRCVGVKLKVWDDKTGFDVETLAASYINNGYNCNVLPTLLKCNANPCNDPPLKWAYRTFMCIWKSHLGKWFQKQIAKVIFRSRMLYGTF